MHPVVDGEKKQRGTEENQQQKAQEGDNDHVPLSIMRGGHHNVAQAQPKNMNANTQQTVIRIQNSSS